MKILLVFFSALMILGVFAGNIMSNVEQPKYKIFLQKGNIELREYEPMIIAEVEVSGERKEAVKQGFKILAGFIFGNNESKEKMEMTAPVMQEQQMSNWKVRFVMPSKYSLGELPKPNSKEVVLVPVPAQRFAVIRFSGLADDSGIKRHTQELEACISAENLKSIGSPILAFYNPPWTVPFFRRNEVMIEVD